MGLSLKKGKDPHYDKISASPEPFTSTRKLSPILLLLSAYLSVPGDLLDRLEMVDDHQGAGRGVRKGS